MNLSDESKSAHRRNDDGTFDSICLRCFITVEHAAEEEDVQAPECVHVCDAENLEQFRSPFQRRLEPRRSHQVQTCDNVTQVCRISLALKGREIGTQSGSMIGSKHDRAKPTFSG